MTGTNRDRSAPRWMTNVLLLAAAYNVLWGGFVVLFPGLSFDLLGIARPNYLSIWQSVGMIVGVYGVGYFLAALAPYRLWPMVLVGLLGKILGPIGFLWTASRGEIPWVFGVHCLANDLVWWIPFVLILRGAAWSSVLDERLPPDEAAFADALSVTDSSGRTLGALSNDRPVYIVLLRHDGCIFCRETLAKLSANRARIDAARLTLALVHQMPDSDAAAFFARWNLDDVPRFSDPSRRIYRGLGVPRGQMAQLLGPMVWLRGARAFFTGHGVALRPPIGDAFQMPGAFVIHRGEILYADRARDASHLPDIDAACTLPSTSPESR